MKKTHHIDNDNPYCDVQILDLMFTTDCNLTCLYCGGMFSSAWRREVNKNGVYLDDLDKNWSDIYDIASQKEKKDMPFFKLVLKEIELMTKLKRVVITGGEPFLYNYLDVFLETISRKDMHLDIFTGLGVAEKRFKSICKKIEKFGLHKKTTLIVSAEGIGKNYELVRQGNTENRLHDFIAIIRDHGINLKFCCSVSNLSIFGLRQFYDMYNADYDLDYNPVNTPNFLRKNVMDNKSKKNILMQWNYGNNDFFRSVASGLEIEPLLCEKQQLKNYLIKLKKHKNINVDCLPQSFLNWVEE